VDARFECSVRVAGHSGDRQIFIETFLSRDECALLEHVTQRLSPKIRASLEQLIQNEVVAAVLDSARHAEWAQLLQRSADAVGFSLGIELLAPLQLHLHSPSFQQQRLREMADVRQKDALSRATDLLTQFQAMRAAAPDVPAGRLLERFAVEDRGIAFQSLLLAESAKTGHAALWAVAGPALVQIDPRVSPPAVELHSLPADLGPLRSVQVGEREGKSILLIGAQRGVMMLDLADLTQARLFPGPAIDSQLGFNRVILQHDRLYAAHGHAGLVQWRLEGPDPSQVLDPRQNVRNLEGRGDQRLIYSADDRVIACTSAGVQEVEMPSRACVAAIVPMGQVLAVVRENGEIELLDPMTLRLLRTVHRGTPLRTAAGMPWQGDIRLLLATEQGPIDCIGTDDPLVVQYLSPYRGFKMVAATTDLLAAVSPDRQRIVCWQTWDHQRPLGEIHVTSRTRHRVADICFG
jgi:hypothetical protein